MADREKVVRAAKRLAVYRCVALLSVLSVLREEMIAEWPQFLRTILLRAWQDDPKVHDDLEQLIYTARLRSDKRLHPAIQRIYIVALEQLRGPMILGGSPQLRASDLLLAAAGLKALPLELGTPAHDYIVQVLQIASIRRNVADAVRDLQDLDELRNALKNAGALPIPMVASALKQEMLECVDALEALIRDFEVRREVLRREGI